MDWEARPLGGLFLRLGLTLIVLFPWNYRFVKVPFRAEDLDPVLLEACKAEGINILNQTLWPTVGGIWSKWVLLWVGLTLVWWAFGLGLALLQRRWGLKVSLPAMVVVYISLIKIQSQAFSFLFSGHFPTQSLPVWGGWLEGSLFNHQGYLLVAGIFIAVVIISEGLLLAARAHRLFEKAKLLAMRSHLAPHFLYNALNTLQGLVQEDPVAAQSGLARLGRLLRSLLENRHQTHIPLQDELAYVEDYLSLEAARLGDRLQVEIDVPEELLRCAVPMLGLQILVENAVKHAIAPSLEGGKIQIDAKTRGKLLMISVTDPGKGPCKTSPSKGLGLALDNLRNRLPSPSDLELLPSQSGFTARFKVPCEVL